MPPNSPLSVRPTLSQCFIIIGIIVFTASAFNIEQRTPMLKVGPANSLFGLSIEMHHIAKNSKNPDNAVILVGAPTADRASEHSSDLIQPGGLFKCGITTDQSCERVIMNPGAVSTLRLNNSNQWMGVRVKSQGPGQNVAVCGHRYTIRGGSLDVISWQAMIGRCYMLQKDLKPIDDPLSFDWQPCLGKQNPNGAYTHKYYGVCQAGTAVDFVKDTTKNEDYIVFGAPGSFDWSGALVATQINAIFPKSFWNRETPNTNYPIKRHSVLGAIQVTTLSTDIFGDSQSTLWPENKEAQDEPLPLHSKLGSSLASGFLLSNTTISYVSGSPGINVTGGVVIFTESSQNFDSTLKVEEIIEGDRIASRFGHEVKLIDVTGDGRLDLIVGAPQYYDRNEGLGGAVYIYVNRGLGKMGPDPAQVLYGKVDSSFGMSISSIGDVNMDGAEDIAIGAPGEDGWKGAVYIYHGNNKDISKGVYDDPVQVITSKELTESGYINQNITGMGYSVSGGLDMDFNDYPDVAVGSLSDSVVLFLTRPIVNLEGTITGPDTKITVGDRSTQRNHDIMVCVKYTSTPNSFNSEVNIECEVKLDTSRIGTDLPPRASFSQEDPSKYIKVFNMVLYPQTRNKKKCRSLEIYINKDIQDKLSPIELEVTYTTLNTTSRRRKKRALLDSPLPIANGQATNAAVTSIEFSKNCGPDEICKSSLAMEAYYQVLRGDKWELLEKNNDGIPVLKLGTEKQIGMMIKIKNALPGEDAHQAELKMVLPDVLEYRGVEKTAGVSDLRCTPDENNATLVLCSLGNPFRSDAKAEFRVKLSKIEAIYKATGFNVSMQLHTTSQQPGHDVIRPFPVIVLVEAQLDVTGYPSSEQIKFGGVVVGESTVKKPTDAGEIHTHKYKVENTGTGPAENVQLNIQWPQTIKNGKWLFYLLEVDVDGTAGNCTIPPEVNPLGLKYVWKKRTPNKRTKREAEATNEAESVDPEEISSNAPTSPYEELICPKSAQCEEIICSLGTLYPGKSKSITMFAVLWNSTFLEEYKGKAQISVQSSASVFIDQKNIEFSEDSKLNVLVTTSVLSEIIIAPVAEVKWWIIAVASLAGVLLLVGIVLLLWKCGFFTRRQYGTYEYRATMTQNQSDNTASSHHILQHQTSWRIYTDN